MLEVQQQVIRILMRLQILSLKNGRVWGRWKTFQPSHLEAVSLDFTHIFPITNSLPQLLNFKYLIKSYTYTEEQDLYRWSVSVMLTTFGYFLCVKLQVNLQLPKLLSNPDYRLMSVMYKIKLYVKFKRSSQHPPPKYVLKSHLIGTNYLTKNI